MKLLIKILLLSITLFLPQASIACDMSAFQQSDFSERCQRLIDFCNKAYIAKRANHPDTEKKLSEVSKDWIDFYLSHGKRDVQPPNMAIVKPEIWERNLNALGVKFNDFIRKNIDTKSFQNLILEVSIFKNEERLNQLHGSFKAAELCEKDITKIEDYDLWLETKLVSPAKIICEYGEDLSEEFLTEIDSIVGDYINTLDRFKKTVADQSKSVMAKQSLFNMINRSIDQTLNDWETQFYYK